MFIVNALVLTFFLRLEATYVDSLTRCSLKDSECLKSLYQKAIKDIGSTGVPELGLPAVDPLMINNISFTILDAITINITEGTVKGIKSCVFNDFTIDLENQKGHMDITCDALSVKGHFIIAGTSPTLQSISGTDNFHGEGRAKVTLEKMNFNLDFKMFPNKKNDEIYISISNTDINCTYDIGNAHFITEKIMIANNDIGQLVSSYLNANWRTALKSFGHLFFDKAVEIFGSLLLNFYDGIPAKKYIIEDLMETLPKCAFSDQECLKNLIQNVLKDISKNGINELSIPSIDPIKLKNIQVSVLGLINITLEDGVARGIKECVIDKIETDLDKVHTQVEITCDLIIKGKYNAVGASPIIQNLFGKNGVRGDGNAKVKIDKLHLKLDYYYEFIKKADGDIYIRCRINKTIYEYDIGDLKISADRIFLGDQDFSDMIIRLLNENWKFVMQSFGKSFFDVAMSIFYDISHKFFDNTPTKYFVTDDLTPYVKNL